ncbi:MAG: hypothetical protein WC728_09995 [Elusimicrobiota bacterium]
MRCLLMYALLLPACAHAASSEDAGNPAVSRSTESPTGWVKSGARWQCYKDGKIAVQFLLKEQHTWSALKAKVSNTFAWASDDGTHLARFDLHNSTTDVPASALRYYDGECRQLFSKALDGEVNTALVLLGGTRLLVAMAKPYNERFGESWIEFGRIHLFGRAGDEMLRLGPYQTGPQPFRLFQGGRFSNLYVGPHRDPETRQWKRFELFLDVAKAATHYYFIDESVGHLPGEVDISSDGIVRITQNEWYLPDGRRFDGDRVPSDARHEVRVVHEYKFP